MHLLLPQQIVVRKHETVTNVANLTQNHSLKDYCDKLEAKSMVAQIVDFFSSLIIANSIVSAILSNTTLSPSTDDASSIFVSKIDNIFSTYAFFFFIVLCFLLSNNSRRSSCQLKILLQRKYLDHNSHIIHKITIIQKSYLYFFVKNIQALNSRFGTTNFLRLRFIINDLPVINDLSGYNSSLICT